MTTATGCPPADLEGRTATPAQAKAATFSISARGMFWLLPVPPGASTVMVGADTSVVRVTREGRSASVTSAMAMLLPLPGAIARIVGYDAVAV